MRSDQGDHDRPERMSLLPWRPLDPDALVRWLAALREWPKDLLPCADPQAHGLSPEALGRGRDAASAKKAEEARRRRVLNVAGKEVDVSERLVEFLPLIQQTLDEQPGFLREARSFSLLDELKPRQPRPGTPLRRRQGPPGR